MENKVFLVNNEGVKSFQNADYNTYYALAELIDNSIQAGAKNIHVIGVQESKKITKRVMKRLSEIIIYDDGHGMDQNVANICLQLGGGNHIGATKNLGKFGMGLPQASGSQCMRTEVYTWQEENKYLHTYLDYNELEKMNPPMLPELKTLDKLPPSLKKVIDTVLSKNKLSPFSKEKGTVIYWKEAHKLNHKTYPAFHRNFEEFIGRVYRYFLHDEKITISLSGIEKNDNKYKAIQDKNLQKIRCNDPLFVMENNIVGDHYPKYKNKATNVLHAEEDKAIKVNGKEYNVRIKFSKSIDGLRNELSKEFGQPNPGDTNLGKLYGRNMGISLLRAGRELKLSDFGFVGDQTNPVQRWWGAEVEFQPELDDLFGVTFDKQEAKSFRKITKDEYKEDIEEAGDESLDLMYKISQILVSNITTLRKQIKQETSGTKNPRAKKTKCKNCGAIAVIDNKCNECGHILKYCPKHTDQVLDKNGTCPICSLAPPVEPLLCTKHNIPLKNGVCELCQKNRGPGKPIPKKEETRLRQYLQDNFHNYKNNDYLLDEAIKYFQNSGKDHFIVYAPSDANSFITHSPYGKITIISINTNHPFYENFMHEIIKDEKRDLNELVPMHLLVGAMINAELSDYENKEILDDFRGQFAVNLKKLMRNYKLPPLSEEC